MKDKMKEVYSEGSLKIMLFKPNIFNLFGGNLRRLDFRENIRFCLNLAYGYETYHLFDDSKEIGYCVVSQGGLKRYPFASKNDIIIGPYFIKEDYRGKKLSVFLVEKCINVLRLDYNSAYDFINKSNVPSIKVTEAMNFKYYSDAKYSKYLRILESVNKGFGDFVIYKYDRL